jgi:long-subunit fatty acid transport protein
LFVLLLLGCARYARPAGPPPSQQFLDQNRAQFNFLNPGARSLALGGAFVGLADDATAAYANPAGLINLSRPEVSVEGRHWNYTHTYVDRGHAFGPPDMQGVDLIGGLQNGHSQDHVNGLSFLSFVYPYKSWSFALYRHELANFQANIRTRGAFFNISNPEDAEFKIFRFFPTHSRTDLEITNYGLSAGYRASDSLSIGLGVNYYDFSLTSVTDRLDSDGFYGMPTAVVVNTVEQHGDDSGIGGTLGLLWKPTQNWSLGAVYRRGTELERKNVGIVPGFDPIDLPKQPFKIPDVWALGTAFHPTDQITLTLDFDRVKYSDTFQGIDQVKAKDADELHFGLEYVVLKGKSPLSFRLGAWLEPDHQASYQGVPDGTEGQNSLAVLFPRGEDHWHVSGGLGFVLYEKLQLDAAVDHSTNVDTASLSAVYRF